MPVYGLRNASPAFINELKGKYPNGAHVTHKLSGYKIEHNGCFYTFISPTLRSWARIDPCVYNPNLTKET